MSIRHILTVAEDIHEVSKAMAELKRIALIKRAKPAATFVILNILDTVLTLSLIGKGGNELMPIARYFLQLPNWTLWLFKVGGAIVIVSFLLILADKYPRPINRILTALVISMSIVCTINLVGLFL